MAKRREGDYLDQFASSANDPSPGGVKAKPIAEGDYLDEFASSADKFFDEFAKQPALQVGELGKAAAEGIGEGLADIAITTPNNILLRQGPNIARSVGLDDLAQSWAESDAEARERSPLFTTAGEFASPNPLSKVAQLGRGIETASRLGRGGKALITPAEGAATSMLIDQGSTGATSTDTGLWGAGFSALSRGALNLATKPVDPSRTVGIADKDKGFFRRLSDDVGIASRTATRGKEVADKKITDMNILEPGAYKGVDLETGKMVIEPSTSTWGKVKESLSIPDSKEILDRIYGNKEKGIVGAREQIGEAVSGVYERLFPKSGNLKLPLTPGAELKPGQYTRQRIQNDPVIQEILNRDRSDEARNILEGHLEKLFGKVPDGTRAGNKVDKLTKRISEDKASIANLERQLRSAEDSFHKGNRSAREAREKGWEPLKKDLEIAEDALEAAMADVQIATNKANLAMEVTDETYRMGAINRLKKAKIAQDRAQKRRNQAVDNLQTEQSKFEGPEFSGAEAKEIHSINEKLKSARKNLKAVEEESQKAMNELGERWDMISSTTADIHDVRKVIQDLDTTINYSSGKAMQNLSVKDKINLGFRDRLKGMMDEDISKINPKELEKLQRLREDYGFINMLGEGADEVAFENLSRTIIPEPRFYTSGGGAVRANLSFPTNLYEKGRELGHSVGRSRGRQDPLGTDMFLPNIRSITDSATTRGAIPIMGGSGWEGIPFRNDLESIGPQDRSPQSIRPDIDFDDIVPGLESLSPTFQESPDEALQKTKIPRSYEGIMENKDIILAKAARENPEFVPEISKLFSMNPKDLKDQLPVIVETIPDLFDYDEYGRVDGVIIDPAMVIKARKDIQFDDTLTNVQKAKLINELNKTNKLEGYR